MLKNEWELLSAMPDDIYERITVLKDGILKADVLYDDIIQRRIKMLKEDILNDYNLSDDILDGDILNETSEYISKEDILNLLERSSYSLSRACSGLSRIEYYKRCVNKNLELPTKIEYRNQIAEYIAELMMLIHILMDQYNIVSYDAVDSYSIARQDEFAKDLKKIKEFKEKLNKMDLLKNYKEKHI